MKALLKKLHAVQSAIGGMEKDEKNPRFRNGYTSLNTIVRALQPHLDKNKLVVTHELDKELGVTTRLWDVESEESMEVIFPMVDLSDNRNAAQGYGALYTYGRRYNLVALFNLYAEDRDAEDLTLSSPAKPKQQPPKPVPKKLNVMPEAKFSAFIEVLTGEDGDKAAQALAAVQARGAWDWTAAQKKELNTNGIDPDTLETLIPFN